MYSYLNDVIQTFQKMKGAISVAEGIAIYTMIKDNLEVEECAAADLGSHAGKSSIFALRALKDMHRTDNFYMIDLLYDLGNEAWKNATHDVNHLPWAHAANTVRFRTEILRHVLPHAPKRVSLFGMSSEQAYHQLKEDGVSLSYVFIDTDDHQYEMVKDEVRWYNELLLPGGLILFHDFRNQYTGPSMVVDELLATGKFKKIDMDWKPIEQYVLRNNLEKGNDSWHMCHIECPMFVGGVKKL